MPKEYRHEHDGEIFILDPQERWVRVSMTKFPYLHGFITDNYDEATKKGQPYLWITQRNGVNIHIPTASKEDAYAGLCNELIQQFQELDSRIT